VARLATAALAGCAGIALVPAVASGHTEISPDRVRGGASQLFTLHVEDERADAVTTRVALQLPAGVELVALPRSEAWRARANGRVVTWLSGGVDGSVTLRIRLRLPDRAGELRFPAVQTYSNGDVDRWIGPDAAEQPAAAIRVRPGPPESDGGDSADGQGGGTAGGDPGATTDGGATTGGASTSDRATTDGGGGVGEAAGNENSDDGRGGSTGLVVGVAAAALILGVLASVALRRRTQ
jgi:periplasmic copper chaperone A